MKFFAAGNPAINRNADYLFSILQEYYQGNVPFNRDDFTLVSISNASEGVTTYNSVATFRHNNPNVVGELNKHFNRVNLADWAEGSPSERVIGSVKYPVPLKVLDSVHVSKFLFDYVDRVTKVSEDNGIVTWKCTLNPDNPMAVWCWLKVGNNLNGSDDLRYDNLVFANEFNVITKRYDSRTEEVMIEVPRE